MWKPPQEGGGGGGRLSAFHHDASVKCNRRREMRAPSPASGEKERARERALARDEDEHLLAMLARAHERLADLRDHRLAAREAGRW